MSNAVRIPGQRVGTNVILGRVGTSGLGPVSTLSMTQLATAIANNGALPLPSGGNSLITSVDSNFTVTGGGALQLHTAADKTLLSNISGGTGEPVANTGTAFLDEVFGNTKGDILYRDTSVWQVLAPGSDGKVLTLASGIPSWASASGAFTNKGAWSNTAAYNPFDVVTYNGSAYLNYTAVAAPGATAQGWVTSFGNLAISTTNTTNDTATSQVGITSANSNVRGDLGKSSGKWYVEFDGTYLDNGTQFDVTTSAGILTDNFGGQQGGLITGNESGHGTGSFAGLSNTKRGAIAVDISGGLFWICEDVTAGSPNWNGSSSNVPGVSGGIPIGTMGTPNYVGWYIQTSGGQHVILYSTPSSFLILAVPTGFSAWSTPAGTNTSPDMDDGHWLSQGAAGAGGLTVGTTTITSGTNTRVLYNNSGVLGEYTISGSGNVVLSTSPTLVTPALGTPSALVLTNATALPAAQVSSGALVNGMTATTQSPGDNSTKLATTAYADAAGGGGASKPTLQIFTSSTGTYTKPAGISWIKVRCLGGGGGGSGGNSTANGTGGGNTTFGTAFLVANGGGGGVASSSSGGGGSGGTTSGGDVNMTGDAGSPGQVALAATLAALGGDGGPGPYGGKGAGGNFTPGAGGNGGTNSGAGGGGGGLSGASTAIAGSGGGAGGYIEKFITTVSATYAYAVGAGGAGSSAGATGAAGGTGAAGIIIVEEYYAP